LTNTTASRWGERCDETKSLCSPLGDEACLEQQRSRALAGQTLGRVLATHRNKDALGRDWLADDHYMYRYELVRVRSYEGPRILERIVKISVALFGGRNTRTLGTQRKMIYFFTTGFTPSACSKIKWRQAVVRAFQGEASH
jgi:hypothetical protein